MDLSEMPRRLEGDGISLRATRHPWETSRTRFFTRVLEDSGALKSSSRILDVGSGDAWFARQLLRRYPAVMLSCWDVGYTAAQIEALEQETAGTIRFFTEAPAAEYDALVLMDVLEHVEDARGLLTTLVKDHLVPGGAVLVSVPAWQCLFSRRDAALRHYRRYSPRQLSNLVEGAGLERLSGGGLFHLLLLPRALAAARDRLLRAASPTGDVRHELRWDGGALLTWAAAGALWVDNLFSRAASLLGLQLPGLTAWCLCRKPS
jgi:hypothetical protein